VSESFALLRRYAEGINNKNFLKTFYCPEKTIRQTSDLFTFEHLSSSRA